jgi:lantibiotic modifying enzyme
MESVIKQKIDSIAECIYTWVQKQKDNKSLGLYTGEYGILLFLFYYSKYSKDKKYISLTENYAEILLNQFAKELRLHTFCSGLSGVLYLFEFLRENCFIDMDVSDTQPALDNYLILQMRQDIQQARYDFMHGALGVGLYFLKKKTEQGVIQELINFLYNTADKGIDNKIFKWKSIINAEKNIVGYNIALSHGISSIIVFLSRVVKSGMVNEKISEMLSGAVNYVLSQQMDFRQCGSCFPSQSLENKNYSIFKSRLAWCYGDLGVAMALSQAGKTTNNMEWQEKGLSIFLQSTQRLSVADSLVQDAGICHGSAGIAMIYNRMFLETRRNEFKEASNYWLGQTINFSQFSDGLVGYKTCRLDGWICDYSLLTGITGIGLVFLSCLKNDKQMWDEMVLLS